MEHSLDESIVDHSKTVCGEIIALEDVPSADNKNSSNAINKKPSKPDTKTNHKHSSFPMHKVYMTALLVGVTLLVIGVMQIPITLFYTDPVFDGIEITSIVDFRECQVRSWYTYKNVV